MDFKSKHCIPCEGGVDPLTPEQIVPYLDAVPLWQVIENKRVERTFTFSDFKPAITFINQVAGVAESEGHHPEIKLFNYKNVTITLFTSAINGLSENDFIMAVRIDEIFAK